MIRLLAACVSAGLLLNGCGLMTSKSSYRYRMRVEGVQSAAAVYEILAEQTNGPRLADEKPGGSIIKGEALTIETPSGPVFVLLKPAKDGEDLIGAITRTLTPDIPWNGQPNFWKAVNRLSTARNGAAKGDLPRDQWPLMVRFGDVNNPQTVERVDPSTLGVAHIVLETTRDPISTGLTRKLKWLPNVNATLRDTGFEPVGVPVGDFKRLFSTEVG